jgi:hypothetical protein
VYNQENARPSAATPLFGSFPDKRPDRPAAQNPLALALGKAVDDSMGERTLGMILG